MRRALLILVSYLPVAGVEVVDGWWGSFRVLVNGRPVLESNDKRRAVREAELWRELFRER